MTRSTRQGYKDVVLAVPVTVPYQRYSTDAAHWWFGAALRELSKASGISHKDIDGLCAASFPLSPDRAGALTPHQGMSVGWRGNVTRGGAGGAGAARGGRSAGGYRGSGPAGPDAGAQVGKPGFDRAMAGDDDEPFGKLARKLQKPLPQPALHVATEGFEPILAIATRKGARQADLRVHVDQDGQVGLDPDHQTMQLIHNGPQVATREPLVPPRSGG